MTKQDKALCFARKHSCESPPEGLKNTRGRTEDQKQPDFLIREVPYRVSSSKSCVWSGGKNFTTKRRMVFLGPGEGEGKEMIDREETVGEGGDADKHKHTFIYYRF